MAKTNNKTIELWDGYEVEIDEQLFDDADFLSDFAEAAQEGKASEVLMMLFAIVGGEKTYEDARKYITDKCGYFSMKELREITDKIEDRFPKAGNRASRRQSWKRR